MFLYLTVSLQAMYRIEAIIKNLFLSNHVLMHTSLASIPEYFHCGTLYLQTSWMLRLLKNSKITYINYITLINYNFIVLYYTHSCEILQLLVIIIIIISTYSYIAIAVLQNQDSLSLPLTQMLNINSLSFSFSTLQKTNNVAILLLLLLLSLLLMMIKETRRCKVITVFCSDHRACIIIKIITIS